MAIGKLALPTPADVDTSATGSSSSAPPKPGTVIGAPSAVAKPAAQMPAVCTSKLAVLPFCVEPKDSMRRLLFEAGSDGDVPLHALCDALLGAGGLGDIGRHFPDTSAEFAGIDSRKLVTRVMEAIGRHGLSVINADLTIVAQAPRMAPHIPAMVARITKALHLAPGDVNVKAKTAEKMGPVGEGRAIEARAICLLCQREPDAG